MYDDLGVCISVCLSSTYICLCIIYFFSAILNNSIIIVSNLKLRRNKFLRDHFLQVKGKKLYFLGNAFFALWSRNCLQVEKQEDCKTHFLCYPPLRYQSFAQPLVPCLKTAILYIISSFLFVYDKKNKPNTRYSCMTEADFFQILVSSCPILPSRGKL